MKRRRKEATDKTNGSRGKGQEQEQEQEPSEPVRVCRNCSHISWCGGYLPSCDKEFEAAMKKWREYCAAKAAVASASKDEHGVPTPDAALRAEMRSAFVAAVKTRTAVASTEDEEKDDQKDGQKDGQKDDHGDDTQLAFDDESQ